MKHINKFNESDEYKEFNSTSRKEAIEWWKSLAGSEIEDIWKKETNSLNKTSEKEHMVFNFRISTSTPSVVGGNFVSWADTKRFKEEEVNEEIINDNVIIKNRLLIRKGDGKVIGQFIFNK